MISAAIAGLEKLIDKFYSNFLLRDLVYITSGLLIVFFFIVCTGNTATFIGTPKFFKIFVVGCSYYIGLIDQELMVALGIFRMFPKVRGGRFSRQEADTIKNIIKLIDSTPDRAVGDSFKRVERIFIIKNIMTAFGSALVLGLVMLVSRLFQDILIADPKKALMPFQTYSLAIMILSVLIAGAISSNRKKVNVQEILLTELTSINVIATAADQETVSSVEDIIDIVSGEAEAHLTGQGS